jgi:hypothetical protein
LRLRIALVAYEYDGCVIDALLDELASGDAVLSVAPWVPDDPVAPDRR